MIPGRSIYPFRLWSGECVGETCRKPCTGRLLATLAKKRLNWSRAAGVASATTSVSSWLLLISFWISRGMDFALLAGVNENGVTCSTRPSGVDGSKSRDSDGESVITQTNIGHRDVGHELLLALSLKKNPGPALVLLVKKRTKIWKIWKHRMEGLHSVFWTGPLQPSSEEC